MALGRLTDTIRETTMKTIEQTPIVHLWCAYDALAREASVARYHARQCWPQVRAGARAFCSLLIIILLFPIFLAWLRFGGKS